MAIVVVNWKHVRGAAMRGEYIGRPCPEFDCGSLLANSYKIGADGTRSDVIEKYRRWLWRHVRERQGAAYEELVRLTRIARKQDLILICWCAPAACHGDVVRSAIEWSRS